MKTIKTSSGIKKIDDWTPNIVPLQLREILQEHRKALIERLMHEDGLQIYINFKMNMRLTAKQLFRVRDGLLKLKERGIDIDNYRHILKTVLENEMTYIDTALFYAEIDNCIKTLINDTARNDNPVHIPHQHSTQLLISLRHESISKILSEKGLQEYIETTYGSRVTESAKLLYIMDELREYFAKEPADFALMLKVLSDSDISLSEGNEHFFEREIKKILDKHFPDKWNLTLPLTN